MTKLDSSQPLSTIKSELVTSEWLNSQTWLTKIQDTGYYQVFKYRQLQIARHSGAGDMPSWVTLSFSSSGESVFITDKPTQQQCLLFKEALETG